MVRLVRLQIINQNRNSMKNALIMLLILMQRRFAQQIVNRHISVTLDKASQEIFIQISTSLNKDFILRIIEELNSNLPDDVQSVIQIQGGITSQATIPKKLTEHQFNQSMSRKRKCLDNAPVESSVRLSKIEFPTCKNIAELTEVT